MSTADSRAFEAIFRDTAARVLAYACRHVGMNDADDVVAETYAIAWRRFSAIPTEPFPWLLVTARNVIRNHRRSQSRANMNWANAVRELWHESTSSPDQAIEARKEAIEALRSCTESEREAVLLVAWDGLSTADAASIADCSQRAFTVRLSRARSRLRSALDQAPERDTPTNQQHVLRLFDPAKETS